MEAEPSWGDRPEPLSFTRAALEDIARSLTAQFPRSSSSAPSDERVLRRLTGAVVAGIPGAEYAGLSLHSAGGLSPRAASDPCIRTLEDLQTGSGGGPVTDVIVTGTTLTVDDLRTETRWPRFTVEAAAAGIRSLLCFATAPHPAGSGAVTVYSSRPYAFDAASHTISAAFALGAAVAVDGARAAAGLEIALRSRDVIAQAKGILMERFGLDANRAFALLVESSQETNTKLVDVARWLVTETTTTTTRTTTTTTTSTSTTSTETVTRRRRR